MMVLVVVFLSLNMPRLVLGIIEVRISLEQYVLPILQKKIHLSSVQNFSPKYRAKLFTVVGYAGRYAYA